MPATRPQHRAPGSSPAGRRLRRRRAILAGAAVFALCAGGFAAGVHAAVGDRDGPAVLMAHPGILPWSSDGVTAEADAGSSGRADSAAGDQRRRAGEADDGRRSGGGRTPPPAATPSPPRTSPNPGPAPSPSPSTPPPSSDDPADPMSAAYNPYTTPGDPAFVTDAAKQAWLGREVVVRECMAGAGYDYLEWQWWFGGSPMPTDLDVADEAAWMTALRGDAAADSASPGAGGCDAVAARAVAEAGAAGTPLTAPIPPAPDGPTPRQHWLEFQDAVRACMADAGLEYRYWEFWNPAYPSDDGSPAMPPGLDDAQRAEWNTAAFGSADGGGTGAAASGCWATGADRSAYREWG